MQGREKKSNEREVEGEAIIHQTLSIMVKFKVPYIGLLFSFIISRIICVTLKTRSQRELHSLRLQWKDLLCPKVLFTKSLVKLSWSLEPVTKFPIFLTL